MASVNLGKVVMIPKGTWSASTAYEYLDIVTDDGSSYVAKQDVPAGTALTNTTYWQPIAAKGDTGLQMLTESTESTATATKNYAIGDLVIVDNQLLRVTSAIANGGTITVGTNAEVVDVETLITEKADADDVYTKAETDTQLAGKADTSVYNLVRLLHPTTDFTLAKTLVDAGHLSDFFSIGEQITGTYTDNYLATPEVYDNPWDIVDFRNVTNGDDETSPAMILQMHWATKYTIVFDTREALFYTETGLPAGTYHFNVTTAWGTLLVGSYQFTLTQAVPAGGQIVCSKSLYSFDTSTTVGVYASSTDTTAIESAALTTGSAGNDLGVVSKYARVTTARTITIDGSDYTYEVNGYHQGSEGYNRWKVSAYRQYLNSDAASGWWTPQHEFDRPPSNTAYPGFLHEMPAEMLAALTPVKILTAINSQDATAEGINYDETIDRVWLPCLEEMYINPYLAGESAYWQYYKDLNGTDTMYARSGTYADLIKYQINSHNSAQPVRLRSAYRGIGSNVYHVSSSGYVTSSSANTAYRCVPACAIVKSIISGA